MDLEFIRADIERRRRQIARQRKKSGVPTLLSASGESKGKSRMEFKQGTLHMSHPSEAHPGL